MKDSLMRFKKDRKFIIFDYETCNLNLVSTENKPWQLAFLVCHGQKIIERFNFYLRWNPLNISEEAAKVTGFNKSTYESEALCPKSCLQKFDSYLYNEEYYVVGHNILSFDIYIHNIHRNLCNLKTDYSYLNRAIDTNCLAKSTALDLDIDFSNFLLWQFKLTNLRKKGLKTNLKFLCEKYQIEFDSSKLHDALYDIEKNLEVFNKMLWKYEL